VEQACDFLVREFFGKTLPSGADLFVDKKYFASRSMFAFLRLSGGSLAGISVQLSNFIM